MRAEAKRTKWTSRVKGPFFVLFVVFAFPLFPPNFELSIKETGAAKAAELTVAAKTSRELSREEKWRGDLMFLFAELPKRHKNLYFKITREKFDREIAKIIESIPRLTDLEIILALRRVTTMIGDPHTRIPHVREKVFPILLYQFPDGVFATAATEEYKDTLDAKLVKIGETSIERAIEEVRPYIPVENEWWFKQQFPYFLTDPEILYGLKILPSADTGDFTFIDRKGKTFVVKLNSVSTDEEIRFIHPFDTQGGQTPLYMRNQGEYYWREYLADSKTIYINYRRCADMPSYSFFRFAASVLKIIDENPVERVVIDLRQNGGGNSTIIMPLLAALAKRRFGSQPGKLFVLIGRGTFSSAFLNALKLKRDLNAILVGEPTGQRPNAYGEVKTMNLPHSDLPVQYSTRYLKTMEDDPPALEPDIQVTRSSLDYASGRDPVLERALSYKGK